jgi:hypothetical protein
VNYNGWGHHINDAGIIPFSDGGADLHWRRRGGRWREEFKFCKSAGVTHVTLNSAYHRNHPQCIASWPLQAHLIASTGAATQSPTSCDRGSLAGLHRSAEAF